MSDDRKLPEEWAEALGFVRAHPREARPIYAPAYRAAQALHYWDLDAYHGGETDRLRLTREQFEAALVAPTHLGPDGRNVFPVLDCLSPRAPEAVLAAALAIQTTPAAEGVPVTEES